MKHQIHPAFAALVIICVVAAIAFIYYKAEEDKPIPDRVGGRIALTEMMKAGKMPPGMKAGKKAGPAAKGSEKPPEKPAEKAGDNPD